MTWRLPSARQAKRADRNSRRDQIRGTIMRAVCAAVPPKTSLDQISTIADSIFTSLDKAGFRITCKPMKSLGARKGT